MWNCISNGQLHLVTAELFSDMKKGIRGEDPSVRQTLSFLFGEKMTEQTEAFGTEEEELL